MTPEEQKAEAMKNLEQGFVFLDKAVEQLSALEGKGYCEAYEQIRDAVYELRRMTGNLGNLNPPTGIWRP